jgi:prepilin-type N-terminal cleavage/methylation domain-containing protein
MSNARPGLSASGFTLVEVLIAIVVFVTISVGIVQLVSIAAAAGRAAREQTSSTILAAARMEQLRSLVWSYEPSPPGSPAIPRSDRTSNLSNDPATDDGPGLGLSPMGTLGANIPPFVDYLDADGRWAGNGDTPPANAAFVRRWAVKGIPEDPDWTLVLQVLVIPIRQSRDASWQGHAGQETLLVSVLTRKGR